MRRGVSTKACGLTIAILEMFVVFSPVDITSFVPKIFFGSLLILIACDLIVEWLVSLTVGFIACSGDLC
jgi:MFS superfamily sulfate permease-like transporter